MNASDGLASSSRSMIKTGCPIFSFSILLDNSILVLYMGLLSKLRLDNRSHKLCTLVDSFSPAIDGIGAGVSVGVGVGVGDGTGAGEDVGVGVGTEVAR